METVAGRTGEVAERSAVLPPGASLEMDAAVLVGGVPVGVEFSVVADEVERERLVGTRGASVLASIT